MERVAGEEVVRQWLRSEAGKPDTALREPAVPGLSSAEAVDELLDLKPGAAAFLWRDAPVTWYRTTLDREAFAALHVVEGPPDLGWRALSPDGTVAGAARRVAAGDPERLADETGVDVPAVLALRDADRDDPLVLSTRRGCVPRYVADGNHRAVATALSLLDGEPYRPRPAYLGVGATPVLEPLARRVCGAVRRVAGRLTDS